MSLHWRKVWKERKHKYQLCSEGWACGTSSATLAFSDKIHKYQEVFLANHMLEILENESFLNLQNVLCTALKILLPN